jgi:hypothetical protein
MTKKVSTGVRNVEPTNKRTSIGRRNIKTSSMNKSRRNSFKKYRGQG